MKGKIKISAAVLLMMIASDLSAQYSQVMHYMNLPQSHFLNPSLRPLNSLYIGLPVITGVKVNAGNNFLNFSDVLQIDEATDSVISIAHPGYDIDKFLSAIKNSNQVEADAFIQTLGLGFNIGKEGFLTFGINERVSAGVAIPGDLITLAFKGNEQFAGGRIDLKPLTGDFTYFREAALGFSTAVSTRVRIGIRAKALFGIGTASINNNSLGIDISEDYIHSLDADLSVRISAPVDIEVDPEGMITGANTLDDSFETLSQKINYLAGLNNLGLGLDAGVSVSVSDRIMLSASVLDLGYIRWKENVTTLSTNGEFVFDGLDLVDVLKGTKTFEEVGEEMLDSLKEAFRITKTNEAFTTILPAAVTAGVSYRLNKAFSLGLLSYTRYVNKSFREALTFSGNMNLGTVFSASASYTFSTMAYDNLGFGIAARAGIFQLYLLADRIPLNWNRISGGDIGTIPVPAGWNFADIRLGFNILFGNRIKQREDKPMVEVL